jgi:hypothetical protein
MLKRRQSLVVLVLCFVLILSLLSLAVYEPFKVKLTLFERFVVMTLLPIEGNYRTLKIVWDLQMELATTEEENKMAGLVDLPGGGTDAENWEAVPPKEIVFGDVAKQLIVDALTKLNNEEKLTRQHMSLYEKFITYAEKPKEKEGD